MQTQETTNNVVSLFANRSKAKEQAGSVSEQAAESAAKGEESFEDVMKRNQANKERMERERLNANKSVLRSYRIKN